MNVIGIDPSLISTGMVVNGKLFNYCKEKNAYGKKYLKKWFKMCENFVTYNFISYREYDNYSDGEIMKIVDYEAIIDLIISDIKNNINPNEDTIIGIEGFSYNSKHGDIIDLVAYSTLLRNRLYKEISKDIKIYSPSTLKLESCKLTYDAVNVGKRVEKWEYRNNSGIAGGNFTKIEMCLSILENDKFVDDWVTHLKDIKDELLSNKKIEKPYEDLNDSYLLYQILKKERNI
jgi:hypothetical protein